MKLLRCLLQLVCCFTLLCQSLPCFAEAEPAAAHFSASYNYYIDLSKDSISKNDFQSFLFYLEAAHSADPTAKEPFELLKNVRVFQASKKLMRGYLGQAVEALERRAYQTALFYFELSLLVTPDDTLIKEYIEYVNKLIRGEITDTKPLVERIKQEYKIELPIEARVEVEKPKEPEPPPQKEPEPEVPVVEEVKEVPEEPKEEPKTEPVVVEEEIVEEPVIEREEVEQVPTNRILPGKEDIVLSIPMDDELWAKQPNTTIEIEFNKSIIMEGQNIERSLALNENYIEVVRIDRDRIQITSLRRGATLFHVWDDRGRWTFNIVGVLPLAARDGLRQLRTELWEEYVEPFRLAYSNNWNAYYLGDSPQNMSRRSLVFTQFLGFYGETPYGEFDASVNLFKFEDSTENTGRAIGLTNGNIGPFKDFTIRGYDTYSRFTDLSLPGRYFRGGLIDAYAFHRRLRYTYLRGQDRANFVTVSEGLTEIRKSYIEGVRMTYKPDSPHQYSLNWARAWGEEKPSSIKDNVFSADTEQDWGLLKLRGEVAYDEDVYATLIRTKYENGPHIFRVNVRDINEDFTTITSRPGNQGEVGGNVIYDWESEGGVTLNASADLYRDRGIPNPDNPNSVNYDLGTFVAVPLTETLRWSGSIYYTDTPQVISPRQNLRATTSLSRNFRFFNDRLLSTQISGLFQRSRFDFTPESEYDRKTISTGFRFPLFDFLSYYLNYDISWVDVIESGEQNNPSVLSMGLSYSQTYWDLISARASVSWRDEEDTEGRFTFLSGTDILRTNVGLSYHPTNDFELYLDGSIRNVLGERSGQVAFNDADVRIGMRTAWDTIFRWNPKGTVQGYVFKDTNKNGIRDSGEPGLKGLKVRVGDRLITTLESGYYGRDVRAESVKVALDLESIPPGHSLTSDESKRIEIEQGKAADVDFGFSVRTEVYGVVFVDDNDNGRFDTGERTVPAVRLRMDKDNVARSDFEGTFTFYEVIPGKHSIEVDVNTIPLEYLPKIKLKHEIVVEEGASYDFDVPLRKK